MATSQPKVLKFLILLSLTLNTVDWFENQYLQQDKIKCSLIILNKTSPILGMIYS